MALAAPTREIFGTFFQPINELITRVVLAWIQSPPEERFILTSWWRSHAENVRVNGSPVSQHLIAAAMDLVPADPRLRTRAGYRTLTLRLRRAGLVAVDEGSTRSPHVHVQVFTAASNPLRGFGVPL